MSKIGILGGTFDPVHMGHLVLAKYVYDNTDLDSIYFMPNHHAPHKDEDKITNDIHRLNMLKLAVKEVPFCEILTVEMEREDKSYTSETLELLKAQHPENDYYLIIGEDSLITFDTWHKPDVILKHAHILVGVRHDELSEKYDVYEVADKLKEKYNADIQVLELIPVDISSTEIRTAVKNGQSIDGFVTEEVKQYILDNKIYC